MGCNFSKYSTCCCSTEQGGVQVPEANIEGKLLTRSFLFVLDALRVIVNYAM